MICNTVFWEALIVLPGLRGYILWKGIQQKASVLGLRGGGDHGRLPLRYDMLSKGTGEKVNVDKIMAVQCKL